MSSFIDSLAVSASGMRAQSARLRLTSENIANTDTPGYHRKLLTFSSELAPDGTTDLTVPGKVWLDRTPPEKTFDPSHPLANADGYFEGSNVNLIIEIADAKEAQRSYEANLKMLEQTRQMASEILQLLRK